MTEKFKVLIIDDHQMFLDGLGLILQSDPQIEVIASFESAYTAMTKMDELLPDLVITDYNMPEINGADLAVLVKKKYPSIKILVLSMHNDKRTVSSIVDAEAEGYILKNSNKSELLNAIKIIVHGGTYFSNEIIKVILQRYTEKEKEVEISQVLSEREIEVLTLIAQELTNDEIANRLFISKRTVETHRKNMFAKTFVNTTVGLLKYAVKNELISLN